MRKSPLFLLVMVIGGCVTTTPQPGHYVYRNGHVPAVGGTVVYTSPRDQVLLRQQDERERAAAHRRQMDIWRQVDRSLAQREREAQMRARDKAHRRESDWRAQERALQNLHHQVETFVRSRR